MKPKITLSEIIHHEKRFRQQIVVKSVYKGNVYSEEYECWADSESELQLLIERNLRYKEDHPF